MIGDYLPWPGPYPSWPWPWGLPQYCPCCGRQFTPWPEERPWTYWCYGCAPESPTPVPCFIQVAGSAT
jgi:hypothetical protein